VLTKGQLDCKGIKKNKAYVDDFAVELTFDEVAPVSQDGDESPSGEDVSSDSIDGVRTRARGISQFAFQRGGGGVSRSSSFSIGRFDSLKSFRSADSNMKRKRTSARVSGMSITEDGGGGRITDIAGGGKEKEEHYDDRAAAATSEADIQAVVSAATPVVKSGEVDLAIVASEDV
jgi:hypothetical protein